jgi:succinate dehydrogenase / fumarate reductase cytochrome b subunit
MRNKQRLLVDGLTRNALGMQAWAVQRVTGIGLALYLLAHVVTMSTALLMGKDTFSRVFELLLHNSVFAVFELLVLAGLLLHALNGVRLLVIDFFGGVRFQKQMFIAVCVIATALFLWLAWSAQ